MRIGGLASGMDIDQMVKDLMKAERMKGDKLQQKKQYLEWQRDDYRSMNSALFTFDQMLFDDMIMQKNFIQKSVSVSDSDVAAVNNVGSASEFSGTLEVAQLAKAARMTSGQATNITDPTKKLSEYFGTGTQTISIQAVDKEGKLQEKPVEIQFNLEDESLNSLMEKINEKTGVTMFYDSFTQKVSMTAKNSGDAKGTAEIVLGGDFLSNQLHLSATNLDSANPANQAGQNAKVTLNGLETERSSNIFNIGGVEYTLKGQGKVNYQSSPDVEKVYDTIKNFVEKYNELIGKVNGELNEKRYRSYHPLTKEQREAMSEKEIELWEDKARSGTLRSDFALSSGMNKMRLDLSTPVAGLPKDLNQLSDIGITTSSNYLERGKLVIDPKKLKAAIAKDPAAIHKLFAKEGDVEVVDGKPVVKNETQGLARRLRDAIKGTMEAVEEKAGKAFSVNNTFSIGKTLDRLNDQITSFEKKLFKIEDRYWRQFTMMEKAIQRSNEQSMSLMNYFK
ncbi:flagellar hook-associated protein 2 [Bacillus xiapuensis]|uniref:flagellar hook-associated protein 2 n=1 Tax=Bacillus xiapuensis TaxID=2014075 RepID=UPI001E3D84B2|nr:flagellar hook-associated protein 2 [Bacillus xiapuensis]